MIENKRWKSILSPKMLINTFKLLFSYRKIVWDLAKSDFKSRYLGSILGILWAFILPIVNLGIIWFALGLGLRANTTQELPYILWLVTGMFPWSFFSDSILSASNSVVDKSYLVKKVVFQVELLPVIKIVAAFFPFLFLSVVMFLLFLSYGFMPSIYWLQIPYFVFCLLILVLSISWFTSAVVVFYRDMGHLVAVALQLGFWLTPIFWNPEHLPANLRFFVHLNPVFYIVNGYRNSFVYKVWFWQEPLATVYFWSLILIVGGLGIFVFRRLRPQFADVL